jgi:hypothetical protein
MRPNSIPSHGLFAAEADNTHSKRAMHKNTARPTVRPAVTRDCYAAKDAKTRWAVIAAPR